METGNQVRRILEKPLAHSDHL